MPSHLVLHLKTVLYENFLVKPKYSSRFIKSEGVHEVRCEVYLAFRKLKTYAVHADKLKAVDYATQQMCDVLEISNSLFNFVKEQGQIKNPFYKILCDECLLRGIPEPIVLVNITKQYKVNIPSLAFYSRTSSLSLACLQTIPEVRMVKISTLSSPKLELPKEKIDKKPRKVYASEDEDHFIFCCGHKHSKSQGKCDKPVASTSFDVKNTEERDKSFSRQRAQTATRGRKQLRVSINYKDNQKRKTLLR